LASYETFKKLAPEKVESPEFQAAWAADQRVMSSYHEVHEIFFAFLPPLNLPFLLRDFHGPDT